MRSAAAGGGDYLRGLAGRCQPCTTRAAGRVTTSSLRDYHIPALGDVPTVQSAHPSPLSARGGFFGSRPFSRTNDLLRRQGADPIDWRLP